MNRRSTRRRAALAFVLGLLVVACATPPVADAPREGSAAIGIQLGAAGPLGPLSSETPEQVFFVRLEGDSLIGENLVRSNFARSGRIYLLNAVPGRYVVVASSASTPPITQFGSPGQRTTFFSRELVELTRVDARPNELAFVGRFEVRMSSAFSGGDEVQLHYRNLITPGAPPGGFWKGLLQGLGGELSTWGALRTSDKGDAARDEFLKSAREDLAGQGWDARLARSP